VADLSGAEALLVEALGIPFLAFVLNESADAVAARLESRTPLSADHDAVLVELVRALGQIPRTDPFSLRFSLAALGEHDLNLGASWATWAYTQTGGVLDVPEASDDLTASLMTMLRDTYPLFLLPRSDEAFGLRTAEIAGPLFRHPGREQFEREVMLDPSLSQLFPEDDEMSGRHGTIHRSTGSGGDIQLAMFASSVLQNGWEFASLACPSPTMRQHAEGVVEVLTLARDAIDGKPVAIPAIVGVAGLRLAGRTRLDLPWGHLRVSTPSDERRIPPGLAGKLTTSTPDGRQVEIDYAGDLVMELAVPYRVAIGKSSADNAWPVPLTSADLVERHLETLRLSLLLSWDSGEPRPVVVGTWRSFVDPLRDGGGMAWSDPRRLPSFVPTELSESRADKWQEWTERVHCGRIPAIDIAIRRTLAAAAERADPTDGFVDAVIAWENLFGASEGEQTLRISAALAWLTGDSATARATIRKKVADLYRVRSKVVHGATALEPQKAYEHRTEALDIAIRALRVLLKDRPELLSDCSTSGERSVRLLLDSAG
jgi:hypothetical protein